MGSSHFVIPSDLTSEWVQIKASNPLTIRNTISQQNFTIHQIHRTTNAHTRQYLRRSVYSLPHTPHIIVLEETDDSLFLLVQQSVTHLKFLLRKKSLLIQVLNLLKDLIAVAQQLKQKYGGFQIKQEQLGVLKNDEILLWINSKFQLNQIQFPLPNQKNQEEAMIKSIVRICQKYCKFNLSFLIAQPVDSFSHFAHQLGVRIQIQKLKIGQKHGGFAEGGSQQKEGVHRSNSPLNNNTSLKNFDHKHTLEPIGFQKPNKKQLNTAQEIAQNVAVGSPSKKKGNRRVTSQDVFEPILQKTNQESLSINQPHLQFSQASIPSINLQQMKIFKDSKVSGSRPHPHPTNQEITFSQSKVNKQNSWDLKKRITCSTQQNIDNFSDSYRRQSTIRWVQQSLAGQKSIIEDYHCLFAKSSMHVSRKYNPEEGYKFNI